jgi:replicative DNA helicase
MQSLLASSLGYELNPNALSTGKGFSTTKYKQILEEIEEGTTGRFLINDASRGRVGTGAVAAAIEAKQPDIVIIDYLTLMQTYGADKWQGVAQLSGDLKVMAENYAVPIVVASQFNRAGTGKDPGPENLSQSDAVGQDSDLIIAITKRSEHLRNMRMIKNRHGSSDVAWPMHFDPAKGIFQEITGKDADRIEDADKDED